MGVYSLTLSYTHMSMKCDSWASLLACTFASPCLGYEPKAKVATDWAHIIFNNLCNELDNGISMLRRMKGIRNIFVNLPWYCKKSFNICLCIKKTIHKNNRSRLKKLKKCRQLYKTKKKLQSTLQEMFLRRRKELRKEEPQVHERRGKRKAQI
jgi:hypothetical protein